MYAIRSYYEFELSVYFGRNIAIKYNKLSLELHKIFQVPLFRAKFVLGKKWELKSIKTIAMNQIPDYHLEFLNESASDFFSKKRYNVAHPETYLYDLAILVNPKEKAPPSDAEALKKFVDAAERKGCYVDFITKDVITSYSIHYTKLYEFRSIHKLLERLGI